MEGRAVVCGGGDALNPKRKLKTPRDRPLNSVFASAPKPFLDSGAMLSFGAVGVNKSRNSFSQSFDQEEGGDEYLDEYCNQPEKKKRISVDQVQFLERNFQAENKLEPERKIQLAKELGLQPRQIAVWFQNRRARWKTRQLETDYETLHASYQRLKTDYDNLHEENEKLKAQVLYLKQNGPAGVAENADLQLCETNELSQAIPEEGIAAVVDSGNGESRGPAMGLNSVTEVETSPDGLQSFVLEAGDSSRFLEFEESELSQNGEDDLHVELWQTDYIFPEIGDAYCHPVVDHVFDLWRH